MPHILLIEPDLSLGEIYSKALRGSGHSVSHCQNAQDAVHSADDHLPDAVVIELELAVHNGVEFLYEFRSYPEWQKVPAIIMSHVSPLVQSLNPSTWAQLEIKAYHYKPATKLRDLIASVERILPQASPSST
jgi:DNA-binding response OmpR family regulator